MTIDDATKKTIVLSILILLFSFILWYFFSQNVYSEPFNTKINITDKMTISSPLENNKYRQVNRNNTESWWNSYVPFPKREKNKTAVNMRYNDMNWKTHPSQVSENNRDFTLSFWIYVNNIEDSMQTIFKIIDPGNESDRVPGVFLIPSEIPALSIRCKSDSNVNDGKDIELEKKECQFPLKTPTFMSIVFTSSGYTLYMNGQYKTSYNWKSVAIQDENKASIELAHPKTKTSFFVRKLHMYEKTFNSKEISLLYKAEKKTRRLGELNRIIAKNQTNQPSTNAWA